MKPLNAYLDRNQEHFVSILPEMLNEFLKTQAIHREIYTKNPQGFTIFWNEDKGDWRIREQERKMGCYFSDTEVIKYFYLADPNMTLVIEKAVVINDMRVTQANMEEFFENIRKMLA